MSLIQQHQKVKDSVVRVLAKEVDQLESYGVKIASYA
jgi:hypothetical protein